MISPKNNQTSLTGFHLFLVSQCTQSHFSLLKNYKNQNDSPREICNKKTTRPQTKCALFNIEKMVSYLFGFFISHLFYFIRGDHKRIIQTHTHRPEIRDFVPFGRLFVFFCQSNTHRVNNFNPRQTQFLTLFIFVFGLSSSSLSVFSIFYLLLFLSLSTHSLCYTPHMYDVCVSINNA